MARYEEFDRSRWAARRRAHTTASIPVDLVDAAELVDVYCPLAELVAERADRIAPFVVALTGSVAVGKSAAAAALAAALRSDTTRSPVAVVSTDGFLHTNQVLAARGLTLRKGFPESFDHEALTCFLAAVRRGDDEVCAPVYSHSTYDIVPDAAQVVSHPSVLILEGLPFPDEHVDFTVYLDAATADIEEWFVQRLCDLCADDAADSPYHRVFRDSSPAEVAAFARQAWVEINVLNLEQCILPSRDGSDVILEKGRDHAVRRVRLRID